MQHSNALVREPGSRGNCKQHIIESLTVLNIQAEFGGEFCGDIDYESNHYTNALSFAMELSPTNSLDHQQMLLENMVRCFHLAGDQALERRARAQIMAMTAIEGSEEAAKAEAACECLATGLNSALKLLLDETGEVSTQSNLLLEIEVTRENLEKHAIYGNSQIALPVCYDKSGGYRILDNQKWGGGKRTECLDRIQMVYFQLCRVWSSRNLSSLHYPAAEFVKDLHTCVQMPEWWQNEDSLQLLDCLEIPSRDEFDKEQIQLEPAMVKGFCKIWNVKKRPVLGLTDLGALPFVVILEMVSASRALRCSCTWTKRQCNTWYQNFQRLQNFAMRHLVSETEMEAAIKQCRPILNKLTPENFESLVPQLFELAHEREAVLHGLIKMIYSKAVTEHTFTEMYAHTCRLLHEMYQQFTCILLTTIGHKLDHARAQSYMSQYFDRMIQMTKKEAALPDRLRFMIQDVLESGGSGKVMATWA